MLVVWEYKPRVSSDLQDQTSWHLSETILQAFYLKKKHPYCILHCLTDLEDYHYFFLSDNGPRTLKLDKYVYMQSNLSEKIDVLHHLNFLYHSVSIEDQ